MFVSDSLRARDIIVGSKSNELESNEMMIEGMSHEDIVDKAERGVVADNIWSESVEIDHLIIKQKLVIESLSLNVLKGLKNSSDSSLDGIITIMGDLSLGND